MMENNLFSYLQLMELMIFFSGYPLLYVLVQAIASKPFIKNTSGYNIHKLVPYAYAMMGLLYLGLQLKNLYPDYSTAHIQSVVLNTWLQAWGLSAVLFFIPFLSKKPIYSLLHSLVFFFFLVRDLYMNIVQTADRDLLKNDMNIYTYSIALNFAALFICILFVSIFSVLKKHGEAENLH